MHVCGDLCSFCERRRSPELVNSMRKQPAEAVHQLCSNLAFFTHVECCDYHFDAIPHQPNTHTRPHKQKQATRHMCACQLTYTPTTHTYVPPELHMFCVSCLSVSVSAYAQCYKPLIMGSRALHSEHTHTHLTHHTLHTHTHAPHKHAHTYTHRHARTHTYMRAHTHIAHTTHITHTPHTPHTHMHHTNMHTHIHTHIHTQTCAHTHHTSHHTHTHTHNMHVLLTWQ